MTMPRWTRRVFMKAGAMSLLSLGAGPSFLDRLALASPVAERRPKVLVTIFLRGAMDGLMAVPPLDDPALAQLRPRLAMSAARSRGAAIHELDDRFGLHPALAPLLPLWSEGRMAVVHAVGSPNPTRSHFDAQDFMETGTPWRKGTASGWLNRTVASLDGAASPFRAVAITPELPRSLYGAEPALAIQDLADFKLRLPYGPEMAESLGKNLQTIYESTDAAELERPGKQMFEALRILSEKDLATYRQDHGSVYPPSRLGQSLLQIAFLIRSKVGLRVAFAESEGWDTHVSQGTDSGPFAYHASDLAASLVAFWRDIEPFHDDVVVLTMTEFGRTVRENGSGGTDHGHGSCLFALGNVVDGGKVYGDFPGLDPEVLFEGRDLPVTTDFRAVFSEVAGKLFNIADDRVIFPGWEGFRLPILW